MRGRIAEFRFRKPPATARPLKLDSGALATPASRARALNFRRRFSLPGSGTPIFEETFPNGVPLAARAARGRIAESKFSNGRASCVAKFQCGNAGAARPNFSHKSWASRSRVSRLCHLRFARHFRVFLLNFWFSALKENFSAVLKAAF